MTDAQKAVEELQKAWSDFTEKNDQRLKEIRESQSATADGITTEVTEKLNADIDAKLDALRAATQAAEKRAEQAELAAKRAGRGENGEGRVKAAHLAELKAMNGGNDVSEEDYIERAAAMSAYLRKGRTDGLEAKAMSVDSDPEGGYTVMPDTSGRVVGFVYESSPMRQFASVQAISTSELDGMYDLDEAGFGWVGEEQARSETGTPDFGKWKIPVHEMYAEPRATQKLLDDSMINVEAWLAEKVANRFARAEATAFVTGDGELKPRGFTTYAAGVPVGTSTAGYRVIEQIASGADGAFPSAGSGSADALINMVTAMKSPYRAGARWAMNRSTIGTVRKLKDADDRYYWQPDFREGASGAILGYPVAEFNDMADVASDSLGIAFANFGIGYQIVDRVGIRVLRDPFTAKPYVKFYTTKRVGGDVVNFEAIKLMKFATSV